jgi:hypothetical protein
MSRACLLIAVCAARMLLGGSGNLTGANLDLIDDLSRRSFLYFSEQTDAKTGLTFDRAPMAPNGEQKGIASIAASGFALTSYCIAQQHHWITRRDAEERTKRTLLFFVENAPQKNGWFYHFMDARTGVRTPNSEVSSIDTAILLAGALTARACFHDDARIVALATELFDRVDFTWMMNGSTKYFSLGWMPETGFLPSRWSTYSELIILYVLGIGSPTHPISGASWDHWRISMVSDCGYTYIGGGPLFIHQYPLAWLDLRDRFAPEFANAVNGPNSFHANYLLNAILATRAQREGFRDKLARKFPGYSENVWGLTASDSPSGYIDWGASFNDPRIDGTVAPSAAAGSLMFTPEICIPALRTMRERYGKKIYGRYGFADAFNPTTGWVSKDVVGIAVGITLLSAENLRSGNVWKWFMSNPEPERALDIAGLVNFRHPLEHYRIEPDAIIDNWHRP